jgi:hypothetical protein
MLPEDNKILDSNHIRGVVSIRFLDVSQKLNFDKCLLIKLGLVSDDFQGHMLLLLMVECLDHFSVRSLAHLLQYLISVGHMVIEHIHVLISVLLIKILIIVKGRNYFWR